MDGKRNGSTYKGDLKFPQRAEPRCELSIVSIQNKTLPIDYLVLPRWTKQNDGTKTCDMRIPWIRE